MADPAHGPSINPKTVDWDQLRIFATVVGAGSFTRAGKLLNLSQSAVSRQISALERSLQVSLFHRHAQGLVLTEPGEEFNKSVSEMAERLAVGLARINECREAPKGPLKITTSLTFGSAWLTSRMNKFRLVYPDISVSLLLVDNVELDLFLRQADVAIRFMPQTQPNLVQRHLMNIRYHVFASDDYLARRGVPQTPADLDDHDIIVYGEEVPAPVADINWLLEAGRTDGKRREPALRVNSVYAIFRAVQSGLGIAALPYYLSEESPKLVEILPELEGPRMEAYLVYPEELRYSRRIAAVREFLVTEIGEEVRAQRRRDAARAVLLERRTAETAGSRPERVR
jgi:DNA-binding transcriptional LysR family regulator